jgi:hypothetical protein
MDLEQIVALALAAIYCLPGWGHRWLAFVATSAGTAQATSQIRRTEAYRRIMSLSLGGPSNQPVVEEQRRLYELHGAALARAKVADERMEGMQKRMLSLTCATVFLGLVTALDAIL